MENPNEIEHADENGVQELRGETLYFLDPGFVGRLRAYSRTLGYSSANVEYVITESLNTFRNVVANCASSDTPILALNVEVRLRDLCRRVERRDELRTRALNLQLEGNDGEILVGVYARSKMASEGETHPLRPVDRVAMRVAPIE